MKILIIPDVHGRTFWKPATKLVNDYDKLQSFYKKIVKENAELKKKLNDKNNYK